MTADKLVAAAAAAREHARAEYSGFRVGCAVEAAGDRVFTGCNIENATYGLTVCAERVAIFKALSEGVRDFRRLCVMTASDQLTPPCGACRQIIWEFCGDIPILLANTEGERKIVSMRNLLPQPFDGSFL